MDHTLFFLLVCLHRSIACLLRPACFAFALRCAHSFARSLTRGTVNDWMAILSVFFSIFDHSALLTQSWPSYLPILFRRGSAAEFAAALFSGDEEEEISFSGFRRQKSVFKADPTSNAEAQNRRPRTRGARAAQSGHDAVGRKYSSL